MIKILVNDGIHPDGKAQLEADGYHVEINRIAQEELSEKLNDYDAIVVRSATKVRQSLIESCPNLKVIARGGVGLDNIDVDFAKGKGIAVINTPAASSQAVAELAFGHLLSIARSLHLANRAMPSQGSTEFKTLKKAYSKGFQLRGRTIGIIGIGRIGQETARIALGLGMTVIPVDPFVENVTIDVQVGDHHVPVQLKTQSMDNMLAKADIISLHIPFTGKAALGQAEFDKMKPGMVLINCARGGTVDEDALLAALENGQVAAAGLDVFENEPTPRKDLLEHPKVSLSPHIGASTMEAQRNIGMELAEKIDAHFKN